MPEGVNPARLFQSVPNKQNYDADTGEYTPDYTLTPLIIQPQVSCMDKDEFLAAGSINHQLANVKWYEIVGGVSTLIESTNTNYEVIASGGQAGRIKVKKNAQPKVPITLEFHAEYSDAPFRWCAVTLRYLRRSSY